MLQINSMPDHTHILVGLRPHQSISSVVQNVKTESSKWIKVKGLSSSFAWQEGYGAFRIQSRISQTLSGTFKTRKNIMLSKAFWTNTNPF